MASSRVVAAFAAIDRTDFLPADQQSSAGHDVPLSIGDGQTNSQPSTVRNMLVLLDVHEGHRVLDLGAGSGWSTALIAHLVGSTGRVDGVELEARLAEWGAANLGSYDMPWASIRQAGRGVLGRPEDAPYDRILVSAAAKTFPHSLLAQLTDTGVVVVPVGGTMTRAVRIGPTTSDVRFTDHGRYAFVPLRCDPLE